MTMACASPSRVELNLIRGFGLRVDGQAVRVKPGSQRLLAFVALNRVELRRSFIAGSLWTDSNEKRAQANLRSSLWRLQDTDPHLIEVTQACVRLADDVVVDVEESEMLAERILRGTDLDDVSDDAELRLRSDLLPDWYDDWLLLDRERYRQLRLHALEELCGMYASAERFGRSISLGLAAIAAEPLRESAHRRLIESHLAEGNRCEAIRQYRRLEDLLYEHLGITPSDDLARIVGA